jgi:transposase
MQTPLFVRPLLADERATLETARRSPSAFTVRRCQILLASAEGQSTTAIAHALRCTDQTVRNVIHAFHQRSLAVLQPQSSRPHTTATIFDGRTCEALRALLHQSPRLFGKPTSRWTLALAAEVSFAQGLTPRLVSDEAIRLALRRLRVSWKRAKHWITSPDPAYRRKKKRRDRLIHLAMAQPTWALGFEDEVWWSRLAQPDQHCWTDPATTHKLQELVPPPGDPAPKALACYGLLVRPGPQQAAQMWLRFVAGRPVSAVTIAFLAWCSAQLAAQGFTALLLIWDNASWHRSQAVRYWIRQHNQQIQQGLSGVRLVVCPLPSKSPWLNPIEPKWVHGKRAVSEAARLLGADELEARVCAYYGCAREAPLVMPKKVA